jgi:hypothetical protein
MQVAIIPDEARLDEAVAIRIHGLAPHSRVHLRLRNHTLKAGGYGERSSYEKGSAMRRA